MAHHDVKAGPVAINPQHQLKINKIQPSFPGCSVPDYCQNLKKTKKTRNPADFSPHRFCKEIFIFYFLS